MRSCTSPNSSLVMATRPANVSRMYSVAFSWLSFCENSSFATARYFFSSVEIVSLAPSRLRLYKYPAISESVFVVPDIADSTTTFFPAWVIIFATSLKRTALPTEVPPNLRTFMCNYRIIRHKDSDFFLFRPRGRRFGAVHAIGKFLLQILRFFCGESNRHLLSVILNLSRFLSSAKRIVTSYNLRNFQKNHKFRRL